MSFLRHAVKRDSKYENPVPTTLGGFFLFLKLLPLYISNPEETEPKTPLGPFPTDLALLHQPPQTGLRITWFGHSAMLLEIDGARILIDPVWERASPVSFAGPKRFFPPTLRLEDLPPLDAILISHDHYDHFGARTLKRLATLKATANTLWITSAGVGNRLAKLGVPKPRITALDWTQTAWTQTAGTQTAGTQTAGTPGGEPGSGITFTALPARHFSGRTPWDRMSTLWSSWVIAGPQHRVYFGADSGLWDGFGEIAATFGPFDLTMLEIGAFHPLWSGLHLGPEGAVAAYEQMLAAGDPGPLFPIHWGLFNLALHGWRKPIDRLTTLAAERGIPLWLPSPGVPTEVNQAALSRSLWWM